MWKQYVRPYFHFEIAGWVIRTLTYIEWLLQISYDLSLHIFCMTVDNKVNYHASTLTPLCMQPPVTAYSTPGIHTLTVWPDAIRFYFKMSNLFLFTMYTRIVATCQIWPQVRSCQNRATSVSEWNVYQQSVCFTIWKPPSLEWQLFLTACI